MTLWQNLCAYALAVLQGAGLTSLGPLSGQSLSTQTDINHNLPSIHQDHSHQVDVDFGFESENTHFLKPQKLPWEHRFVPIIRTDVGYPTDNKCNSAQDRQNWCDNTNINTNYYDIPTIPKTNVTRHYTIILTSGEIFCGDGYCRPVMLINGTYPGPLIRASWGDWLHITVINKMFNYNGTSIHWHGVRQYHTPWADGVPGVTQCPIPPGKSMTYVWQATQYGSSWYHSHFSLQYPDGIAGPIVIDGPSTMDFHEDKGPLLLSDWYHKDAFSIYYIETTQGPPQSQSVLINGMGVYSTADKQNTSSIYACNPGEANCSLQRAGMYSMFFEYGKKYKLRLINTSTATHFSFWIDGHDFTITSTDFVPIKPYKVNYVNVAIGQRYDIIIEAKSLRSVKKGFRNFWIKMRSCDEYCVGDPCPANATCNYVECRQGIVSYKLTASDSPDRNWRPAAPPSTRCRDPPLEKLLPQVQEDLRGKINPEPFYDRELEVQNQKGTQGPPNSNATKVNLWNIKYDEAHQNSFMIDWEKPTLKYIDDHQPIPDPRYVPITVNTTTGNSGWVMFVILTSWDNDTQQHAIPGAAHPIHLHGHDFVILEQVEGPPGDHPSFNISKPIDPSRLINPPRRDVVMLPSDGYVVIAFKVDNPGSWLMHCHIAWHASAGLALQWVEQEAELQTLLANEPVVMGQLKDQCNKWTNYYNHKSKEQQEDSGI